MKDLAIYVHIPFCKQKCHYCDFCSFSCSENIQKQYFKLLEKEILLKSKSFQDREILSVYFGGGTPSFVEVKYIVSILELIKSEFKIKKDAEITIECNPCSTTLEKLQIYRKAGFNRISFGVQSFSDKTLKALGRLHTSKQARNVVKQAQKTGFDNISCDLMIGVPFQTEKSLIKDAKTLVKLGINHISSYMLQVEEGTPLEKMISTGDMQVADEEVSANMYQKLISFLDKNGFYQYEVSNFAKNKTFSQHNLNYWKRGEYLGLGLSASSFIGQTRFSNSTIMAKYRNQEIENYEKLSREEILEEVIMLGLRCFEGFSISEVKNYGFDVLNNLAVKELVKKGILKINGDKITCNPKFYSVNNEIISNIIKEI